MEEDGTRFSHIKNMKKKKNTKIPHIETNQSRWNSLLGNVRINFIFLIHLN